MIGVAGARSSGADLTGFSCHFPARSALDNKRGIYHSGPMGPLPHSEQFKRPFAALLCIGLAAAAAPATGLLLLATQANPVALALIAGPVLAISLMSVGMIAAAATGRLWLGIALALLTGAGLVVLAQALGMPAPPHPLSTLLAFAAASVSFAARGALFARSSGSRGWWIAVAVVAGEAAIVATAVAMPDALPAWLLALLPAQWATTAFRAALNGTEMLAASPVLLALGGTAATTLLVAALWPRRWPYLIMFSAWIALSALVYHAAAPAELVRSVRDS